MDHRVRISLDVEVECRGSRLKWLARNNRGHEGIAAFLREELRAALDQRLSELTGSGVTRWSVLVPRSTSEQMKAQRHRDGTRVFVLDDDESWDAPAVVMLEMPPGYVLFRHAHICHRFEVVVKGTIDVGGRVLVPGDVMTARPGELYGPHTAGPDGCTTAEVFGSHEGVYRVLAETREGVREFDFRKGEMPDDYQLLA